MRVYHRPIDRYTHPTGWVYIDPDSDPTVITRLAGGGATIETLTGQRYATGMWFIVTTDALYANGVDYEMVWTVTIAGSVGDAPPELFRHVTPGVSGAVPDPPAVGTPAVGDTWATFPNTSPPGSTTTITVTGLAGIFTGSGSGATITVTGLDPSSSFDWYAESVSAGGVHSLASAGNPMGSFTTLPSLIIARPLLLKYYVSNEGVQHEYGPRELDVEHEEQGITIGDDRGALGVGECISLRYEGNYSVPHAIMDITLRYVEPQQPPFGHGQTWRSR